MPTTSPAPIHQPLRGVSIEVAVSVVLRTGVLTVVDGTLLSVAYHDLLGNGEGDGFLIFYLLMLTILIWSAADGVRRRQWIRTAVTWALVAATTPLRLGVTSLGERVLTGRSLDLGLIVTADSFVVVLGALQLTAALAGLTLAFLVVRRRSEIAPSTPA